MREGQGEGSALDPAEPAGGRRARATLNRTGEVSRLDIPLAPRVEPAMRYDPRTGQMELPGGAVGPATSPAPATPAAPVHRGDIAAAAAPGEHDAPSPGEDARPQTRREAKRSWRADPLDEQEDTTPRERVEALARAARRRDVPEPQQAPSPAAPTAPAPTAPAPTAPAPTAPAAIAARDHDPGHAPRHERRGARIPGAAPPVPTTPIAQPPAQQTPARRAPTPSASSALPDVWPPRRGRSATASRPASAQSAPGPPAATSAPSAPPRAAALLERAPGAGHDVRVGAGDLRVGTGTIPIEPPSVEPEAAARDAAAAALPDRGARLRSSASPARDATAGAAPLRIRPADAVRPADAIRAAIASPATLVGLAAFLITALGSWAPSLWYGEAAVLAGARRGFGEMLALLVEGSPSQALATACTWLWSRLVGDSELLLRLPSAVAVGLAAAGVVVLGMKGANARAGTLAGVLFAVMPRTTGIGMDLEGFAWSIALAVWSTVALLSAVASTARDPIVDLDMPRQLMPPALRRSRAAAGRRLAGRWAVCLGLAVLAGYAFPTGALVLLVHPSVLVIAGARRGALREWGIAAIPAVILLAPLAVGVALAGGLDFRAELAAGTAWKQTLDVIAPGTWGWLFVLPLAFATARGLLRIRSIIDRFGTTMLELSLASIVLPTLALLLLHALARLPLHPDYFAIIAPGVALFAGYGLATGPRSTAVIAVALACLCALPSYALQRIPPGEHGADGRDAAAYVSARALEGEGLLLDGADPLTHPRQLLASYPSAFEGLVDIGIAESAASSASLWDASVSGGVAGLRLEGIDRLWVIRSASDPWRTGDPELETMRSAGFAVISTAEFRTQLVYELVRTDAFGLEADGSPPAGPELPPVPTAPPTTYPEPNAPVATAPTTIGPDGTPTAIPSPRATVDPLAHMTPTP